MPEVYWLNPDTLRISGTPTGLLNIRDDNIDLQIELAENGLFEPVADIAIYLNRARQLIDQIAVTWIPPPFVQNEPESEPERIEPLAEPDPEP